MQVKSVNETGAFLDWGLMKDLLVPFGEQKATMREGGWYLVYVRRDNVSGRIMASAKIDRFLDNTPPCYQFNQEVGLTVAEETSLGYRVIIDDLHWGLLYHSEIFRPLHNGDRLKGYIKEVREDGKIDVSLAPLGYKKVDGLSAVILDTLNANGGYLPVHDKSGPDQIQALFHCSKKAFKQAIGLLYKQQLITLEREGIRRVESGEKKTTQKFPEEIRGSK
jgi:predicted RNA-binding protein (virulence factor B family)